MNARQFPINYSMWIKIIVLKLLCVGVRIFMAAP